MILTEYLFLEVSTVKKKLVTILVVIVLVLALGVAGALGFVWYRDNHIFVEGKAYPIHATELDLREEDISIAHYNAVQSQLPDCKILWMVPFHGGKYANTTDSLLVSELSTEDIDLLVNYFPELKTLDASQCDDYAVLTAAEEALPECEVIYSVNLEGASPDHNVATLIMGFSEEDSFDVLMENLAYLPKLANLTLTDPALSLAQVEQLREAYPNITISCTAKILGQEYDMETAELDLSGLTSAGVAEVVEKLPLLPNVTSVNLMTAEGTSQLTKDDVKTLMTAAPNVVFHYTFDFFGTTVSTADEEIVLKNVNIGDDNEGEVRLALDLLTGCKRFVLDSCKLSDEVMAKIREDYREQTKVVWRVWFGGGSCLTDAEVIRCTYDLVDDNCNDLVYCEDVRFVDFGHNEWLDSCEFVSGMKNLEYCILSGAPIKSLEPFANCKNLKFLEVAFCEYIDSVEPLKNCTQLEKLNISNTHVTELTALDDLPLTHFVAMEINAGKSRVAVEEQNRFLQQHPDCWTQFDGKQPYDEGWRRDTDGKTSLPHYAAIQIAFRYPHAPNNAGWYLSEEERTQIEALHPMAADAAPEEIQIAETVPEETISETTAVE